jgi:glutamate 5-kinase
MHTNEAAVESDPEVIDNILIVKVGTNVLLREGDDRGLDTLRFLKIGEQLMSLHKEEGVAPIVVSSGAIAAGMYRTLQLLGGLMFLANGLSALAATGTEMSGECC